MAENILDMESVSNYLGDILDGMRHVTNTENSQPREHNAFFGAKLMGQTNIYELNSLLLKSQTNPDACNLQIGAVNWLATNIKEIIDILEELQTDVDVNYTTSTSSTEDVAKGIGIFYEEILPKANDIIEVILIMKSRWDDMLLNPNLFPCITKH